MEKILNRVETVKIKKFTPDLKDDDKYIISFAIEEVILNPDGTRELITSFLLHTLEEVSDKLQELGYTKNYINKVLRNFYGDGDKELNAIFLPTEDQSRRYILKGARSKTGLAISPGRDMYKVHVPDLDISDRYEYFVNDAAEVFRITRTTGRVKKLNDDPNQKVRIGLPYSIKASSVLKKYTDKEMDENDN